MTATHHHHHTLAPSYTGTVVLDIGGDTGALVIHTGPELLGAEIEVSPVDRGSTAPRTHSAVRPRRLGDAVLHSAVYPELTAGTYTVWATDDVPVGTVTINGGRVGEFTWPDGVSYHHPAD
ncbi:phospholipase [Micromonospora zhanjiangensis]|uniref:Phospholipase n=1 Tax=Micromonospora zhanjiangensis TaxID=1522057 RepID=A0ABV8KNJ7_9ACTN